MRELLDLTGKSAVVTGGAMGIGYGIAYRLAEAGASVVIADMNKEVAESTAAEFVQKGMKAAAIQTDISKLDDVARMMETAVQNFGGVDILVNNAGIYPMVRLMELRETDFEKIISVNLKGAMFGTQAAAKQMISQGRGGRIINITSVDAIHPSSVGLVTYDASKHGLWGFTKNSALELAPHNIHVNAIAPGGINTPARDQILCKANH